MKEDTFWKIIDLEDRIKERLFRDFFSDNPDGKKFHHFQLLNVDQLIRIWKDFTSLGFVPEKYDSALEKIIEIVTENILKLRILTYLSGHTEQNPDEDFEMYGFTEDDKDNFWWYFTDGNISDYGLPKLEMYLHTLLEAETLEQKVYYIDRILNVVHQRSDLTAIFLPNGTTDFRKLAELSETMLCSITS